MKFKSIWERAFYGFFFVAMLIAGLAGASHGFLIYIGKRLKGEW